MNHSNNVVSVSGMYWTGSSAVIDIFLEHPSCNVIPDEFSVFSYGQFFDDIYCTIEKERLINSSQYLNLTRLLRFNESEPRYIYSAARFMFRNFGIYPKYFFHRRTGMGTIIGKDYDRSCYRLYQYLRNSHISIEAIDLHDLKCMINDILFYAGQSARVADDSFQGEKKLNVYDQLIAPAYVPAAIKVIPQLKVISVDRDWRDQYVEVRSVLNKMLSVHRKMEIRPCGESKQSQDITPMDYFVQLRKLSRKLKAEQSESEHSNIMWVDFEDIVQDTPSSVAKMFEFLNLDYSLWTPNKKFHPSTSKKNIGIWCNSKWKSEIDYIEAQLE